MKKSTLFIGIILLVASCSTPSTTAEKAKPGEPNTASAIQPIPGLEVPIRTFEVSATEKSTIALPNGGSITFPANAFVDEAGKSLSGTVQIEWQEFHSLTDILFSGIPMAYDSAGVQSALQSGGMFTINGTQNDKPVEIAPNKSVAVNLASNNAQEQFNFYSLDEKSGTWSYETTANATPNPNAKQDATVETDNSKYFSLNMHVNFKRDSFPELKKEDILAWEVLKSQITTKDLAKLNTAISKATVVGKSGSDYLVEIVNPKGTYTLNAHPVTFESKAFSHDNGKKSIQEQAANVAEFQNLSTQGKLIRSMNIPGFGTYNWDCMYHRENEPVLVDLTIPGDKASELASFFFVVPKDGIVIPITNRPTLHVPKGERCAVIAISSHNTVHSVPYNRIQQIMERKVPNRLQKIVLSPSLGKLNKPSDMTALLEKCV